MFLLFYFFRPVLSIWKIFILVSFRKENSNLINIKQSINKLLFSYFSKKLYIIWKDNRQHQQGKMIFQAIIGTFNNLKKKLRFLNMSCPYKN
jgi:hypothetical protein